MAIENIELRFLKNSNMRNSFYSLEGYLPSTEDLNVNFLVV